MSRTVRKHDYRQSKKRVDMDSFPAQPSKEEAIMDRRRRGTREVLEQTLEYLEDKNYGK